MCLGFLNSAALTSNALQIFKGYTILMKQKKKPPPLRFLSSDGSQSLPAPGEPALVSLDNSALNFLTKPEQWQGVPTAAEGSAFLKGLPSGSIIVAAAVVERHYLDATPLRDFPRKEANYLNELTGYQYGPPSLAQVAHAASVTLCSVFGYVLCVMQARHILDTVGGDDAEAALRIVQFRTWAESAPEFGGTTLVASGLYEALGKNVDARKAFALSTEKVSLDKFLNAAWDLYQLQFMLNSAVDAARSSPCAVSVYMTRDQRLSKVWSEYRILDGPGGVVAVLGATNGIDPILGPLVRDGIGHGQELANRSTHYRRILQRFPAALGATACTSREDKITRRKLQRRCGTLAGYLKHHPDCPESFDSALGKS